MARPTNNAVKPRSRLLPSTALTVVKASTMSRKYSGGPSLTACSATNGADMVTSTVARVPATKEPMAEVASAAPARPLRAILKPSIAVTMVPVSPGVFSRMEVVEPPYIAP